MTDDTTWSAVAAARRALITIENAHGEHRAERRSLTVALNQVRAECDAIETRLRGEHDEVADDIRDGIARIRTAIEEPTP